MIFFSKKNGGGAFQVSEIHRFPSFQVSKFPRDGGREDQWEAWNWSCHLRANERPWKKLHPIAHTDRQKHGNGDSMTNSSEWGQVGERYNFYINLDNWIFLEYICELTIWRFTEDFSNILRNKTQLNLPFLYSIVISYHMYIFI